MKSLFSNLLLRYFRLFAKIQLWKIKPEVIGVTGSSGKTSVMEAIQCVLQDDWRVKISEKANSQSGLPLNILGLEVKSYSVGEWLKLALLAPVKLLTNWQKYDVYIAEMGIDSAKWPANMQYLLTFLHPKVGVFTSVTSVHAQGFDHLAKSSIPEKHQQEVLAAIAEEKGRLIQSLPPDGWAVLNEDDALVKKQGKRTKATTVTFGTKKTASVQLVTTSWTAQGTEFVLRDNYSKVESSTKQVKIDVSGYLLPTHYGLTLAAAGAVGLTKKISLTQSAERLQTHFKLPPGRASLLPGINNSTILDSSYNSSPLALHDFFEMLLEIKKSINQPSTNQVRHSRPEYFSRHPELQPRHPELTSDASHPEFVSETNTVSRHAEHLPRHAELDSESSMDRRHSGLDQESSNSINTPASISYPTTTRPILSFTRFIALLGDIRELGQATQAEHERAAHAASQIFDQVFLVGPQMTKFAAPIFAKNHIPTQVFSNPWQVIAPLTDFLQSGDLLFIKGSQNTLLLETTIEPLLKNPSDQDKLCRRSVYWSKQRALLK